MTDFHPKVRDTMMFHHLLPGYSYGLQDPSDSFYMRQQVAFQNGTETLGPTTQATINIASNEGFLDTDDSYLQCYLSFPAQYSANNTEGSNMAGMVLDQFASSIVQRLQVKCGGQILSDFQQFSDYHHIMMLKEDTSNEQMAYFSESLGILPTGASAVDYRPATLSGTAELQKYQVLFGKPPADATELVAYNDLIQERLIEDVKRASKFFQLGAVVGADLSTNLNMFNSPYSSNSTNNMDLYCILLKLSDIPCFSSKQYFPMFAMNGPLQLQIYWQPFEACTHNIGFTAGGTSTTPGLLSIANGSNTYTIFKLECIASMILPKPDFIDRYMLDVVATGNAIYKGEWVDFNSQYITGQQQTLLFNVSMARLTKSIYIKKEQLQNSIASQTVETKRYTVTDQLSGVNTPQIGTYSWRGNKWYSPFGKNLQIYTRVNGVTYPNANGSILINEHLIKEQTEEVLGKLIGLKDERRFYFDQQILAFNYKKDTHSSPLSDVSGLNLAISNQVQLIIQSSTAPASTTSIIAFHVGEIVIQFTPQGSLLLFR